jgi:hypothetical protein
METDAASIFDHYLNYLYILPHIFFPITYTRSIKIKNDYGEKLRLTSCFLCGSKSHDDVHRSVDP